MPQDEPGFDGKLLTPPAVLLHKLDIDTSPAAPSPAQAAAQPRVLIQKLDIELPIAFPFSRDNSPGDPEDDNADPAPASVPLSGFTKTPVIVLARCPIPKQMQKNPKRVCFNVPEVNLDRYTLVGPHRHNVHIQRCHVNIARDDLGKLMRVLAKKDDMPTTCKLCGKVYLSRKKLHYHLERKHDLVVDAGAGDKKKRVSFSNQVIVHKMQYHRCRKCLKVFESYAVLKGHMKSEHKKRNCYVCDYCQKLFADRVIFKLHIKLHCVRCAKLFDVKRELLQHRKRECHLKRVNKKTCKSCNETYFSNLALMDHSFSHLAEAKVICDFCKEPFSSKCPLLHHLDSHGERKGTEKFIAVKSGMSQVYQCMFCSEVFVYEGDAHKHFDSKMAESANTHQCEYCPKKFKIEKNLLQHMWAHLRNTVVTDAGQARARVAVLVTEQRGNKSKEQNAEVVTMKVADKKVESKARAAVKKTESVSKDVIVLNGRKRPELERDEDCFIVNEGNEAGAKPSRAANRMKLLQFKCERCNKSFAQKSSLNRHMVLHNDYVNLQCHVCEETFAWPSLVRDHRCILDKSIPERSFEDNRPEIQLVPPANPETNFCLLEEELPATNDITNEIDFDIPVPIFEFASMDGGAYAQENPYSALNGFNRFHTKYKIVRQEVPIEF